MKSKNRTLEETQSLVNFITTKKSEGLKAKQIQELLEWTTGQYEAFTTKNGLGRDKRSLTNEEVSLISEMKANGSNMNYIAAILNITKSTLEKKLQELKLTNSNQKKSLSSDQLNEVKILIKNRTTQKEIASKFNIGLTTLQKRLEENNIETKLYKVKHDYFSVIDTEEKVYFLGLLYADGYNAEERNQIKLKLHRKDKEILESFAKALTYGESLPPFTEEQFKTDTLSVQLYSEQLCNDLNKLGCMQAKSLIVQLPTYLNKELMRHFIRGYFDGDGSIFLKTRNNGINFIAINFVGCEKFITQLHNYLHLETNINNNKISKQTEDSNAWQVAYSSYLDIQTLKTYLYKDCNSELYLKRKFDKFPTQEYSDETQLKQKIIKSEKISLAQTGSDKSYCKKEILITNIETQEESKYNSVVEASVALSINKDTIRQALYHNTVFNKIYTVIYTNDVTLQLQTNL